ncbi:hypothetical protein LACBS_01309 [Latilactobacillus sakei subsp. sakei DSM 20017 = JCM 1157]|nr:hypothetical protein LACBS_01309 [Latilactobacillus sakei subsp. sakei DSM 20017 = JCM 1157]
MNDVIYLFTSSGKNVVIFEDLDRFNNPTIYERLYEINLLVNKRFAPMSINGTSFSKHSF